MKQDSSPQQTKEKTDKGDHHHPKSSYLLRVAHRIFLDKMMSKS